MKKFKFYKLLIVLAFLLTFAVLHFFGDLLETNVRVFYRDRICDCDTLRFIEHNDSLGVPYINYFSITGKHIGIQRNPTSVSFAADRYFQNISEDKDKFQNCVNWIIDNSVYEDSCLYMEYKFEWVYNTTPNWRSAMAQGMTVKTLTQAFNVTQDSIYLGQIEWFLNSFHKTVSEGGISYKLNENEWWYEEYAQETSKKPHVLNGMMYALDGLYYNYLHTKNQHSLMLFNKGINALKANIHKYDNGAEYSFYDIYKKVSPAYYHNIHVEFLNELYEITNDDVFLEYHKKWSKINEFYIQKSIMNLNQSFFVVLIGVFILSYLLLLSIFYLKKNCCKKI